MKTYLIYILFSLLCIHAFAQSSILPVNDGLEGIPKCMFHDSLHQRLYIGGGLGAGLRPYNSNQAFTGLMYLDNNKNWGYIYNSLYGEINTMTYYNGELYVGGAFQELPPTGALIGFGKLQNDTMVKVQELQGVRALHRSKDNQKLYIGGEFSVLPWPQLKYRTLLTYDGDTAIETFPQFMNYQSGSVHCITEYKNQLYVGGNFSSNINLSTMSNIIRWDGTQWLPLGQGTHFASGVGVMLEYKGNLIVGVGEYVNEPHIPGVAQWDGQAWDTLSPAPPFYDYLMYGEVGITHLKEYNGDLYIIAGFEDPWDTLSTLQYCYRWDGATTWERIAAFDGYVNAIEFFQDELYFCGDFSYVNGQPMSRIAKYSFMTGISDPLQPKDALKVYPNPAKDRLHLLLPPALEGQSYDLKIMDTQGKTHYQSASHSLLSTEIDIAALAEGMYFVQVTTQKGSITAMWRKE